MQLVKLESIQDEILTFWIWPKFSKNVSPKKLGFTFNWRLFLVQLDLLYIFITSHCLKYVAGEARVHSRWNFDIPNLTQIFEKCKLKKKWVLPLIEGCFWILYSEYIVKRGDPRVKSSMEAKNPKSITTNPGRLPPPLKNCQNPKIHIFTNKPPVFFVLWIGTNIVVIW